jgi:hypothetical protein
MPSVEAPSFEIPSMPSAPTPSFEVPSVPSVETPSFEIPNIPSAPAPTYEAPSMPSTPAPTYEVPSMPSVENIDFSTNNVSNPNLEEEIIPTIEVGPIVNPYVQNTQNTEIPADLISIPSVEKPNLRLALNTIRECESTLEKLGFTIETEEIDFQDNYQVIFKIQK